MQKKSIDSNHLPRQAYQKPLLKVVPIITGRLLAGISGPDPDPAPGGGQSRRDDWDDYDE